MAIWGDLESSFNDSKYEDRLEYVKHLIGYTKDKGFIGIDYIKSRINEDAGELNVNEITAFTNLTKMFELVKSKIELEEPIESFDSLDLNETISRIKTLTDELIASIIPDYIHLEKEDIKYLPYANMIKEYNTLEDIIQEENGKPSYVSCQEYSKDYLYLKSNYLLLRFSQEQQAGNSSFTTFHQIALLTAMELTKTEYNPYNRIYLSSELYKEIDGEIIVMGIGSTSILTELETKYGVVRVGEIDGIRVCLIEQAV